MSHELFKGWNEAQIIAAFNTARYQTHLEGETGKQAAQIARAAKTVLAQRNNNKPPGP